MTIAASPTSIAPPGLARGTAARVDVTGKPSAAGTTVELSADALALIAKLKARDAEVRQHEQAHLAVAGSLAVSGASYTYQRGPDGINYAVGGEVQIDTSAGRTPEETIARAQSVMAAALAPSDPSGPDRAVAAQAQQLAQQARAELAQSQAARPQEAQGTGDPRADAMRRAYGDTGAKPATIDVSA